MSDLDADLGERTLLSERRYFGRGLAFSHRMAGQGAIEVGGTGAWIDLSDGRRFLDLGSYGVAQLGRRHPLVVDAVRRQLDVLPTSSRSLAHPGAAQAAETLVGLVDPPRLTRCWFGHNGADVVEAALKLARAATGRPRVLAVEGAYHGKTLGALAVTSSPLYRHPIEALLRAVTHIDPGDPLAVGREVAAHDVAALIIEPVQGEGGVRPLDPDVLRTWSASAATADVFVIADEVQCGLRRYGPVSVAVAEGLRPDAVLFGKALGGGVMPASALVATPRMHAPIGEDPFFHSMTFSGHPLTCAAVSASLEAIEVLSGNVARIGGEISTILHALHADHPTLLTCVRGRALLWGIELATPDAAGTFLLEAAERGLVLSPCLGAPEVIRLMPPMVMTPDDVAFAAEALRSALVATTQQAEHKVPASSEE